MIRVSGSAKLRVEYSVDLDMTEGEFDNLSEREQNGIIDEAIEWMDACRGGETDDIDVYEIEEIEEEESA